MTRRKQPLDALAGESDRRGVLLHRIHAAPSATRVEINGATWRADGPTALKVDVARRLAVCWNICEGIPTAELERGFWRDLTVAIDAGDLAKAKEILAAIDRGIDMTDGRPHDCKACLGGDAIEPDPADTEAA